MARTKHGVFCILMMSIGSILLYAGNPVAPDGGMADSHSRINGKPVFPDAQQIDLAFADYKKLAEKKRKIQKNDPNEQSEYQSLLQKADRALEQDILSVTQKKRTPPSGDKHDYLSLAPYWWPDPKKADGLPYIWRDGRVNPTTRGDNVDYPAKDRFFQCVNTLGMAAFYSDNPKYAKKAAAMLEAWFVNPETRMNPNLEYAQGVPGINDGRGLGIIEWSGVESVITPIQLLQAGGYFSESAYQEIVHWFELYLDWLQNSEKGKFESTRENNHGTWYDVQAAGLMLFLGEKAEAAKLLENVKTQRIATQIEPDGRMPHELARSKSFSYSKMNLSAFNKLVFLGRKVGIDLWNYQTPDGRSIAKAQAFLDPYLQGHKKWTYRQLSKDEQGKFGQ